MVRGQRKGNGQRHCSLLIVACSLLIVNLFAACSIEGDVQSVRDRVREENKAFTVTFNSNSGAPAPAPQSVAPGGRAAEPAAMARSGYTFGAWYKEADFINQWNFAADTVSGDITLHAKWIPITYTVAYEKNQPEATGTMESSVHTYDVADRLTINAFVYDNNAFVRWNTLPDGQGASYSNGQSVLNLTDTAGATVTLYAVWADYSTVWTVRFETSGGSAVGDMNILKNTRVDRPEPDPARAGYTFANWYSNPGLVEPPYNFNSLVVNNITLHAKWIPITYTVAYDKNADDAAGTMADSGRAYDDGEGLPPNAFTRAGHTFSGWNTQADGQGAGYSDGHSGNLTAAAGETVTLYAQWLPNTAGIALNVGQITEGAPLPDDNITIHQSPENGPTAFNISINASDFDAGSILWETAGAGIYAGQTVSAINTDTFTLDGTDTRYNSLGGHTLRLTVRKDSMPYMVNINFTVAE